jgi:hypothetical protein
VKTPGPASCQLAGNRDRRIVEELAGVGGAKDRVPRDGAGGGGHCAGQRGAEAVATGDRCDEYGGHNGAVGDALDQLIIGTLQRLR